jgi:hypothetical protein
MEVVRKVQTVEIYDAAVGRPGTKPILIRSILVQLMVRDI